MIVQGLLGTVELWGGTPAVSSKLRSTPAAAVVRKSVSILMACRCGTVIAGVT